MKTNPVKKSAGINSTASPRAFTLIELLTVISIIALLAAFTIPVMKSLKRREYINEAQAEMAQLETAIDSYKAAYGFYPPSNPSYPLNPNGALFNPLYFELLGTTNSSGTYQTLDGSASILATDLTTPPTPGPLGVSGFINCTRNGAGEDAPAAKNFLPDLKSKQIGSNITNLAYPNVGVTLLISSVGGPDLNYQPMGSSGVNPWRYLSPGINNPNSYDLWIQLSIGSTFSSPNTFVTTNKYLICNWSKQIQHNSTLP